MTKKLTAKKLRIIEQIDQALIVLDREASGYEYIVDTMESGVVGLMENYL